MAAGEWPMPPDDPADVSIEQLEADAARGSSPHSEPVERLHRAIEDTRAQYGWPDIEERYPGAQLVGLRLADAVVVATRLHDLEEQYEDISIRADERRKVIDEKDAQIEALRQAGSLVSDERDDLALRVGELKEQYESRGLLADELNHELSESQDRYERLKEQLEATRTALRHQGHIRGYATDDDVLCWCRDDPGAGEHEPECREARAVLLGSFPASRQEDDGATH